MSDAPLPYRDFYFPLNAFMHILSREEGDVPYLHYALFETPDEPMAAAQERSTELLLRHLPPPPARLLEVGIGLATTLARLTRLGYAATGITPDARQVAMARARHGDAVDILCIRFEDVPPARFDALLFQESSQYIEADALFAKARTLAPYVVVLDEFTLQPIDDPAALHRLDRFLEAAVRHGFTNEKELDLSAQAAPTIDYFVARLPRYRDELMAEVGLTPQQVTELIDGGTIYRERYARGIYGYRLLTFRA